MCQQLKSAQVGRATTIRFVLDMNLMKDRLDNSESWEDLEQNIEGSTSEKHPSSNRERFVDILKTLFIHIYFSTSTDQTKPITAEEAAIRQNVRFAAV